MSVYYNENDPRAAGWLRALIAAGHIPAGTVDERSIADVKGDELAGYSQCHFFAGIGGWPHALALAGWPVARPVWTGSCPCQPFSAAGKRQGTADARHLWPEFRRLIAECSPSIVFGEQVASKDGREWLAGVRVDLEGVGYGVGAADLCAAGAGAPHIRQRLFWVADAAGARRFGEVPEPEGDTWNQARLLVSGERRAVGRLGDAESGGRREEHTAARGRGVGDRSQGGEQRSGIGFWAGAEWLPCLDGKARRIEPGSFPLAHGVPARVGRLRGYGNAIVPQVAAEFIAAYREAVA